MNYLNYTNIVRFADNLFAEKDFSFALSEYQRALFISNQKSEYQIKEKIAYCYWNLEKFEMAIKILTELLPTINDKQESNKINILLSKYYIKQKKLTLAKNHLNKIVSNYDLIVKQKTIIFSYIYLLDKDWENLNLIVSQLNTDDSKIIINLINEIKNENYKSPILAGLLSSIIPGLGKFYVEKNSQGLYPLLYTSLATYMSYKSTTNENKNFLKTSTYGGLAISFYLGNIYGSYSAAKIYNETIDNNIYTKIINHLEF